jgi:chromosome segregation ATPase
MYFVAGLLVAGLVMMLILPAFWRRALRLSERRARLQTPLSVNEAIAERDQLRAEHAVSRRRLERRVEALEEALAEQRAALGREVRRVALDEDNARRDREVAYLRDELVSRNRDILAIEGELGVARLALHQADAESQRARDQLTPLRRANLALETRGDEQRAAIAGLETRLAGLEARLLHEAQAAKRKEEALETARSREARDAAAAAANRDGDQALREAIAQLGADIVRLAEKNEEPSTLIPSLDVLQKREPSTAASSSDETKAAPALSKRARKTSPAP